MKGQWILISILLLGLFLFQRSILSQSLPSQGEVRVKSSVQAEPGTCSATAPYCTNLLRNGGFEGSFLWWSTFGNPRITNEVSHSGCCSAALACYLPNAHDVLWQSLTCPFAAAGVRFSGWVMVDTHELLGGEHDLLTVNVQNSGDFFFGYSIWNYAAGPQWRPLNFEYFPKNGLPPGQTWQVTLDAQSDEGWGSLFLVDDLSLTFCCAEDHYEPYNDYFNAYYIVPGATYEVRICPNGDEDWFRFPVAQGQWITAELYNLPADFDLNLYSNASRQLCTNHSGTLPETCQVVADTTDEWRVRVSGPGGSTSNSPALLRVQVVDFPPLQPTSTPTPTATSQVRPTRTPTTTPGTRATGTLTPPLSQRMLLAIIMKQHATPNATSTPTTSSVPQLLDAGYRR